MTWICDSCAIECIDGAGMLLHILKTTHNEFTRIEEAGFVFSDKTKIRFDVQIKDLSFTPDKLGCILKSANSLIITKLN